MKIAFASDLHLNFADLPETFYGNPSKADILILAGDTVESYRIHEFEYVFHRLTQEYNEVFMVRGNHELYGSDYERSLRDMKEMASKFKNLWFLEDDSFALSNDILLVGGILWTDYNRDNPITKRISVNYVNDYRYIFTEDEEGIRAITPDDCYKWHNRTKQYIRSIAAEYRDKKVVVATHYAPSLQSIHSNYRGQIHENGSFASDLSDLILDNENIVLWIHGHTHFPCSYEIGQCKVECNPRGYPNERGRDIYENYRPKEIDL
jgi:predicted phosphodiesterase